jgi:hypothetical protein
VPVPTDLPAQIRPAACRDTLHRSRDLERGRARTAHTTRGHRFAYPGVFGHVLVTVSVVSYREPPAPDDLRQAAEVAACPTFTYASVQADDGRVHCGMTGAPPMIVTCAYDHLGTRLHMVQREDLVVVGHNVVAATVGYTYHSPAPRAGLPDELDPLSAAAVGSAVAALAA